MGLVNSSILSPWLFTSLPSNSYTKSENFSDWLNTAGVPPTLDPRICFLPLYPFLVPLPPTPTETYLVKAPEGNGPQWGAGPRTPHLDDPPEPPGSGGHQG